MCDTRLRKRLLAMKRAKATLDETKAALDGYSLHELKSMFPGVGKPRGASGWLSTASRWPNNGQSHASRRITWHRGAIAN